MKIFFHDNKISSSLSSTSRLKNNSPFKKHLLKFTCTNIITSNKFIPSNYITKKKKKDIIEENPSTIKLSLE